MVRTVFRYSANLSRTPRFSFLLASFPRPPTPRSPGLRKVSLGKMSFQSPHSLPVPEQKNQMNPGWVWVFVGLRRAEAGGEKKEALPPGAEGWWGSLGTRCCVFPGAAWREQAWLSGEQRVAVKLLREQQTARKRSLRRDEMGRCEINWFSVGVHRSREGSGQAQLSRPGEDTGRRQPHPHRPAPGCF